MSSNFIHDYWRTFLRRALDKKAKENRRKNMSPSYINSIVKQTLINRSIAVGTKLFQLEADVAAAYAEAQELSNQQMDLIAEAEALAEAITQLEQDNKSNAN